MALLTDKKATLWGGGIKSPLQFALERGGEFIPLFEEWALSPLKGQQLKQNRKKRSHELCEALAKE